MQSNVCSDIFWYGDMLLHAWEKMHNFKRLYKTYMENCEAMRSSTHSFSPSDKNKAQPLPTRTTIPKTIPQSGQLPTRTMHTTGIKPLIRTKTCTVGNCPPGELSGYACQPLQLHIISRLAIPKWKYKCCCCCFMKFVPCSKF